MKINDIYESTTAGAIATVAAPMTTQSRNASIYGGKKGGNLLTGKKTKAKYANSKVNESFDTKQKVIDYFIKRGKTAAQGANAWERGWRGPKSKTSNTPVANKPRVDHMAKYDLDEAKLKEDDVIIVPGQGHRLKSGFIPHDQDRTDHEVEMAKSDLFQAAKNAKQVHELIHDVTEDEGLEGWVQEKIIKANDYLNTVREYLEHKMLQNETGGVIAAGGVGESLDEEGKGLWANIHAKRERIKKGSGERMRKPGSKGAPSAQDFKDAAKEGVGEKIKGVIRREKAKDLPLVQTRRDYAMGKAGEAYNKGETRKGNQYSAYAERDRKKKNDPTTNPAGTYRTKTSDYTNEGALVDNLYKVRYKNTETGETKDIKIRAPSSKEAREQAESDYTHDSRVWKCLGTKEITNEAQSMGTALKNTLAKAEPGSKLDNSIKSHNRHIKAGLPGTLKNAPTGYHFDSKGYCRLGDK